MQNDTALRIGIVGGNGRMGRWFARFFSERGCAVEIADTDSARSAAEMVRLVDAVLFSVPISTTVSIIESLVPFVRPDQILLDVTSLKSASVKAMCSSPAEVLGLHPLFGPFTDSCAGQVVAWCAARPGRFTPIFEKMFRDAGAVVRPCDPEEHDRLMAFVQGVTHFTSIVAGECMRRLGLDVRRTLEFASPIYRLRMEMVGRVFAQDSRLYGEIASENPEFSAVLAEFNAALASVQQALLPGCGAEFAELFERVTQHLGGFPAEALAESNEILAHLAARKDS